MTLSGATTLGQSESGSDGNEGVLCFPQSFRISEALPLDFQCHMQDSRCRGVLLLFREAVDVFYSPSRLGNIWLWMIIHI